MGVNRLLLVTLTWCAIFSVGWADDIVPLNQPENDLVGRLLSQGEKQGLLLAPLSGRLWSREHLLQLAQKGNTREATALQRLLRGHDASSTSAISAIALLTAEEEPRFVYRVSGIQSFNDKVDVVFTADTTRSLYEQRPLMPWLYTAQLRLYTSLGEWRVGQAPLRWGGGYSGAMLLSDYAPPLPHLSYRQRWHFGRQLGTWQFEQVVTRFEEDGSPRYVMARRLSRKLSDRWSLSLSEAFKANKLPDAVLAVIAPFYLYQHVTTRRYYPNRDEWFNYLADIQVQYRWREQRAYLEILLDDLQAPRWLTRYRYTTPRKSGILVGYHTPLKGGGQLVVEVIHTDGDPGGGTYSYKIPENRWRYRDAVLGHPAGTNRDMLYLRLDHPLGGRGYLALEHVNARRANATPLVSAGQGWTLLLGGVLEEGYVIVLRWSYQRWGGEQLQRTLFQIGRQF